MSLAAMTEPEAVHRTRHAVHDASPDRVAAGVDRAGIRASRAAKVPSSRQPQSIRLLRSPSASRGTIDGSRSLPQRAPSSDRQHSRPIPQAARRPSPSRFPGAWNTIGASTVKTSRWCPVSRRSRHNRRLTRDAPQRAGDEDCCEGCAACSTRAPRAAVVLDTFAELA